MAYVAVDFDGTITTKTDYPVIGELRPNCERVLRRLVNEGHRLILWTCREGEGLDAAVRWLADHALFGLFDSVNDHPQELRDLYPGRNPRKLGADVFIDDRDLGWYGAEFDWEVIELECEMAGLMPERLLAEVRGLTPSVRVEGPHGGSIEIGHVEGRQPAKVRKMKASG